MKLAGDARLASSGNIVEPGDNTRLGDLCRSATAGSNSFELARCVTSFDTSCLLDDRPGFGFAGAFMLKLLLSPPKLKALPSDCLLNASNSGFWSSGTTLGDAAAVERTVEDGGLQFCFACCGESVRKVPLSAALKPK